MSIILRGAAAVSLMLIAVPSGCTESSDGPAAASTAAIATTAVGTTPTDESEPATAAPAGDDDVAAIRAAFETFYDGAGTTVDAKVAALEDGERYRSMLVDASLNPQFQSLTIDIRDVRLATAEECVALGAAGRCGIVTHDLLVSGAPALVAQESTAVEVDGVWLVAASSWCAVVALGGETCP